MVLLESERISMGEVASDFNLLGVDGREYSLSSFDDKRVLIVMFICNHCPYVHAVIDRIVSIQNDYFDRGVALIAINSNDALAYPDDDFEHMKSFASQYGLKIYLHDESQEVARTYNAQCTPDMFVYKKDEVDWKLVYHGRIDDNWKDEKAVVKHEMREALDSLLRGNEPNLEQNPSMGCSIKWKS